MRYIQKFQEMNAYTGGCFHTLSAYYISENKLLNEFLTKFVINVLNKKLRANFVLINTSYMVYKSLTSYFANDLIKRFIYKNWYKYSMDIGLAKTIFIWNTVPYGTKMQWKNNEPSTADVLLYVIYILGLIPI